MTDIFQEVEEDIRRERMKKLWDRFGPYIVAVAVLIVAAVAAWRGYEWWVEKRAIEAGEKFAAAMRAGDPAEAERAFAALRADAPAGYTILARFSEAGGLAARDRQAAIAAYDALARDAGIGTLLQDLARVRAGLLLVDTAAPAEMLSRMEALTGPQGAFRHSARELVALSHWRAGDMATSRRWVDMILADPEVPGGLRTRAELLRALLGPAAAEAAKPATN